MGRGEGEPDRAAAAEQVRGVGRGLVVAEDPEGRLRRQRSPPMPRARSKAIMLRLVRRRACSSVICTRPSNQIGRESTRTGEMDRRDQDRDQDPPSSRAFPSTSRSASTSSRARRKTSPATSSTTSTRQPSSPPRSWPGERAPRHRRWCASPRPSASRAIPELQQAAIEEYRNTTRLPAAAAPAAAPSSPSTTPSSRARSAPTTRTSRKPRAT